MNQNNQPWNTPLGRLAGYILIGLMVLAIIATVWFENSKPQLVLQKGVVVEVIRGYSGYTLIDPNLAINSPDFVLATVEAKADETITVEAKEDVTGDWGFLSYNTIFPPKAFEEVVEESSGETTAGLDGRVTLDDIIMALQGNRPANMPEETPLPIGIETGLKPGDSDNIICGGQNSFCDATVTMMFGDQGITMPIVVPTGEAFPGFLQPVKAGVFEVDGHLYHFDAIGVGWEVK